MVLSLLFSQLALANYLCPAVAPPQDMATMMAAGVPCEEIDKAQPALCHQHVDRPRPSGPGGASPVAVSAGGDPGALRGSAALRNRCRCDPARIDARGTASTRSDLSRHAQTSRLTSPSTDRRRRGLSAPGTRLVRLRRFHVSPPHWRGRPGRGASCPPGQCSAVDAASGTGSGRAAVRSGTRGARERFSARAKPRAPRHSCRIPPSARASRTCRSPAPIASARPPIR